MTGKAHHIRRLAAHGFSRSAIARYTGASRGYIRNVFSQDAARGQPSRVLRRWSEAERAELERLADEGLTDGQIAKRLGIGLGAVARQRCTLAIAAGAYQGRPRKHCRRTIGALVDEGKAPKQIAQELGIDANTVRRIVREITP